MKPLWKNIPGYTGFYQVSSQGDVKSLSRRMSKGKVQFFSKEKLLKPQLDYQGYLRVKLIKQDKGSSHLIHRLVLSSFIGFSKLDCNHRNGIKTDNRIENLEYCTDRENQLHAIRFGLHIPLKGEEHPHSKLTEKKVRWILKNKDKYSQVEIGRRFGVYSSTISSILKSKSWKHVV